MPTVLKELVGIEAVSKWYMSLHVVTKIFIPFSISLSILYLLKILFQLSP